MKLFLRLRVIVITCALSTISIHLSAQSTWYVNDESLTNDVFTSAIGNDVNAGTAAAPFRTITQAIASAVSGDSIYVDAGDYSETVINITKSVTIRGVKYGVAAGPLAVPVGRGTGESFLTGAFYFGQSIDNITVDGFHINMGSAERGIEARGLNSKILNNIVVATLNFFVQQCGISTRANGPLRLHSYEIRNNHVSNSRFGIYFDGNLENPSEIFFNYVFGAFSTGFVLTGSGGHHYKGNVVENCLQGMIISLESNLIEQNTIRNNIGNGIRMAANARLQNNVIVNNYIENNAVGINLTESNAGAVNNRANYNSMTGNAQNIISTHADEFDAACNWHGTTDITIINALITGNVRYAPFLLNGVDQDPVEPGFQTDFSCIVVPVKLTSFTAEAVQDDVHVQWTTEREVNNERFEIERSTNGVNYTQIGTVNGNGTVQTVNRYRFVDAGALRAGSLWFYRLKQVDIDGRFEYSPVVVVKGSDINTVSVFPNPTKGVLNVRFNETITDDVQYRLLHISGAILRTGRLQSSVQQISVNGLSAGMYILELRYASGKTLKQRITVLR